MSFGFSGISQPATVNGVGLHSEPLAKLLPWNPLGGEVAGAAIAPNILVWGCADKKSSTKLVFWKQSKCSCLKHSPGTLSVWDTPAHLLQEPPARGVVYPKTGKGTRTEMHFGTAQEWLK